MVLGANSASIRGNFCIYGRRTLSHGRPTYGNFRLFTLVYLRKHAFSCVYHAYFTWKACNFGSCGRGESNSQGVVQAPHSLPRRARLPVSSRPRRVETRRGLVAAGLVCRWLPPRAHSSAEPRAGIEPALSAIAMGATYHSSTGALSTSGPERNTAPGRSCTQALCDNFFDYAILAHVGPILLIERLHVTVQAPLGAPLSETRASGRHTDARRFLDRERQACSLQETPETGLAQTQKVAAQVNSGLRNKTGPESDSRPFGASTSPSKSNLWISHNASSTYFRRSIRFWSSNCPLIGTT